MKEYHKIKTEFIKHKDSQSCSPKIRNALTPEEFDESGGTVIDCPKLPITTLIDDIEQEVIEAEVYQNKETDAPCFRYKVSSYPPSHHC